MIRVGQVMGAYGLAGAVKVLPLTDFEDRFDPGARLVLDGSRRRRIARGSGTQVSDVNRLLKQREMIQKLYKQFGLGATPGRRPVLPGPGRKLFGG